MVCSNFVSKSDTAANGQYYIETFVASIKYLQFITFLSLWFNEFSPNIYKLLVHSPSSPAFFNYTIFQHIMTPKVAEDDYLYEY